MDADDVVLAHEALAAGAGRDRVLGDDSRIARDIAAALREQRARFAPGSGHPVAMMLDEWVARLEAYAERPLLPVPD